ncbi:putative bifunctional diguanylate cyclase/phosphodiesterase [Roseobacter sp. HKCCA0434]|uniref:putative bifunctional diguanylate cyclase/phosphodiesterase n=1 Tax=Roseobacter sp. HKCCA0434 TaxID=3079297 RepID=UPI002905B768|nr:EAL domain-containing protein [Roseobacter sp. HKCCA0434]
MTNAMAPLSGRFDDPAMHEILAELMDRISSPVFVKTPEQVYLYANRAFCDLYPDTPVAGVDAREIFGGSRAARYAAEDRDCLETGRVLGRRQTEDARQWLVEKVLVTLPDGSPGIAGVVFDVTRDREEQEDALAGLDQLKRQAEQRALLLAEAKEKIEYVSLHDPHTGLPNRRYLERRMEEASKAGETLAVLHVDLDRFKQINDTFGHFTGDYVLRQVATLMTQETRLGDFVARIGGDEFAILCAHDGDADRVEALADRIVRRLANPIRWKGVDCRIGASVGVALPRADSGDALQLLQDADVALYQAKDAGRGQVRLFSPAMQAQQRLENRLLEDMHRGLERDEFRPLYEVQMRSDDLALAGVEALARWHHPTEGLLSPGRFLSLAERHDLLRDIDQAILRRAARDLAWLDGKGIDVPRLSVNVSAQRLATTDLVEEIAALDIPRGRLSFELIETILFDETDPSFHWQIDRLRELGVGIEVDDFGTGYASIVSLMRLHPDRMKIDRQFIAAAERSDHARRVIAAMIDIGGALDVEIVAEGIETAEQARMMGRMGCGILQGWLFAKPMSVEALARFARTPFRLPSGDAVAAPGRVSR